MEPRLRPRERPAGPAPPLPGPLPSGPKAAWSAGLAVPVRGRFGALSGARVWIKQQLLPVEDYGPGAAGAPVQSLKPDVFVGCAPSAGSGGGKLSRGGVPGCARLDQTGRPEPRGPAAA